MDHKKELSYKRKKYKDNFYGYYVCSKCCSFSEKFLERLKVGANESYSEIMVSIKENDIVLLVK